jgi:epsilon-lactone hydrolase
MISFKAHLFNFLLRNRHLFEGKLHKEKFDENTSIEAFRAKCEAGASRFAKIPDGLVVEPNEVDGIKTEWLIPANAKPDKIIFYVHGGGYVSGSCNDHRAIVSKLAQNAGIKTFIYQYRLAPEHPYPAAVDDSVKMFTHILALGYKPSDVVFVGESAGGGLCLALLLALKDKKIDLPSAAVAIQPWTDLTCTDESYRTKNHVSVAPINSWNVFSRYYVGNHRADLPYISPLYGDLHGLPPILINAGTNDELIDGAEKFFEKAKAAGVDILFRKGEKMVHCYPLLAPMFPEAVEAMDEIVKFIRYNLDIKTDLPKSNKSYSKGAFTYSTSIKK